MGSGTPADIKNALPCESCSNLLTKQITPTTEAILYFNDASGRVRLNLSDIAARYKPFEHELFLHNLDDTLLTNTDKKLVGSIVDSLRTFSHTAELYITGSSSGRGGPKSLLAKELTGVPYWDIDLLAVFTNENAHEIQAWFGDAYTTALASVGVEKKVLAQDAPSYILELGLQDSPDFIYRRIYWPEGTDVEIQPPDYTKDAYYPSSIDLSVGRSIQSTLTPNYLRRKWYARLA